MSTPEVHIKQEFVRFAENISVKGVSRILKARNIVYRVLWSMAVVISFCILLWQLSIVFMKYFTWPVDTLIEESSEQPRFPDVTICNIHPNYDLESMLEKMSWLNYTSVLSGVMDSFQDFSAKTNFSDEKNKYLSAYFYSRAGYISNFPIVDENVTLDDQLIKLYQAYNWQWQEIKSKMCEPILNNQWDPNYYACRTLRVPEECQGQIRGITVILYIHNFPEVLQLSYRPNFIRSQATGAFAVIHAPGTLPILKMAQLVGPGTENNIRFSSIIRTRLSSPYSDCTNQKYVQSKTDITEKKLIYTKDVCIDVCFQQQVLNKCGCLNSAFLFTPEQKYEANGMVCGNLSLLENTTVASIDKGMKDMLCSLTTPMDLEICKDECKNHCDEVSYDLTTSSAPWPQVSTQLAFAAALGIIPPSNKDFRMDQNESKFDIYRRILDDFNSNNKSSKFSDTLHELEKVDLIEKNFLRLNIFFEGYTALVLKDVPSLTTDKMLGLIGGGLSLWLGISIMTLVEVFEFVCKLVQLYLQKNKIAERSDKLQFDLPVAGGKTPL